MHNLHDMQLAYDASINLLFFFFPLMYGSVNVIDGEKEERIMITGLHTVVDIFCVSCGSIVGWKYVRYSLKLWFLYLYSVVLITKGDCIEVFILVINSGSCT